MTQLDPGTYTSAWTISEPGYDDYTATVTIVVHDHEHAH
jgi:hypothetical protein